MVNKPKKRFIDLDLQKTTFADSLKIEFSSVVAAAAASNSNLVCQQTNFNYRYPDLTSSVEIPIRVVTNSQFLENLDGSDRLAQFYRHKYLNLLYLQLFLLKRSSSKSTNTSTNYPKKQPESVSLSLPVNVNPQTKTQDTALKPRKTTLIQVIYFWIVAFLLPPLIFWGLLDVSAIYHNQTDNHSISQVAGVREDLSGTLIYDESTYSSWITAKVGLFVPAYLDLDGDGLTNLEEFWLNTDPTQKSTCNANTDLDNLLQLIHPATCQPLDLQNPELDGSLIQIFHFPTLAQKLFLAQNGEPESKSGRESLYDIFQVQDLSQINPSNRVAIEKEISLNTKKNEYLLILQRINDYIIKHRSYEEYDRNYPVPVSPAVFLETSLRYKVPLKYVLAVARLESRFGTDRYTKTGQLTRPGAHQNIFAIGLDDSGNNLTFNSWEESVYAFGRWYRYFDDKGVSDCRKWRIYNPNGDYCAKVEKLAEEIEQFIFSR